MKLSLNIGSREFGISIGKSLSSLAMGFLRGDDSGGATSTTLVNSYQQSEWVYACIRAKAKNVAKIPFRISRGEQRGENIIEQGEVVDLFDRPHPQMDSFIFKELLVTWLELRGKCHVVCLDKESKVIPLNAAGGRGPKPVQMIILNPDRVTKVVEANTLLGYRYYAGFNDPLPSQQFIPEEIITLRYADPFDFYEGMAPAMVAHLAAQTDYAAAQFMKGLMLNNADTGVVVTTEQQMAADQREQMNAALRERKRKAGTADRPLFLWGGAKLEKPTLSSTDMQYLENRKFNLQAICAIFGVPQEVLGFNDSADRAAVEAIHLAFIENEIIPLCRRIETAESPIVQTFDKNLNGWFDEYSLPIMQNARRARFASAVTAFGIGVPIDTCSSVFDLGLPKLPHDKKSFLPYSLQEFGSENHQDTKAPSEDPPKDQVEDAFSRAFKLLSGGASVPASRGSSVASHQCSGNGGEYHAALSGSVKNKTGKLKKFFFEQRGRVLAKLEQVQSSKSNVQSKAVDDIFDMDAENEELLKRMKPLVIGDLGFGGAQLFKEIGLDDFKLKPADAISYLENNAKAWEGVNQTTFDRLKNSLSEGLSNGDTFEQLSDRVKEIFQDASDLRAESIAMTETNKAVNSGRFNAMEQAKVEKKGWQTSNLEGVRASHLQAEQNYADGIPLAESFRVGGYDLKYPGDPDGPAQEVINCRCFTFAILDEKSFVPKKVLTWEEHLTNEHKKGSTGNA